MNTLTKNLISGIIIIVVIAISAGIFFFFGQNKPLALQSVEAKNGDITEQISLTGQVKASQGVDLAFESQGKIVANYVKTGDKIYAGQALVAIDSSVLQSQLQQAQAQLDALNINTVQSKTDAGIQALYATSLSAAQKSVNTAKGILLAISDLQFAHFTSQTTQNIPLTIAKGKAVNSLLGKADADNWATQNISQLTGGAYGAVQTAIENPTQDNINSALSATQTALQDISNLINTVPIDSLLSATDRANLSAEQTAINAEIITTSANISAINTTKVNNSATITTTNAQIEAAQATVNAIKTQISKTVLRALFDGQVDKDNVVLGQIISPNVPVITISNSNLEIDTSIPEIDVAQAKIGQDANITLDAFGNNTIFPATIISIDTAPSTVNNISVYGAKLKFKNSNAQIKTGMTANINIISASKKNVLLVPKTAVIGQDGKYFVIVDLGNSKKESREVSVGISDSKNIEIISGLKSGEKVLAY